MQEFINLGVDFGETDIMWAIDEDNYAFLFPRVSHICRMKSWKMLPAPSLENVMEALPSYIGRHHLKYGRDGVWYMEYAGIIDSYMTDSNILFLASNMLRWVCENHPETLTKTE